MRRNFRPGRNAQQVDATIIIFVHNVHFSEVIYFFSVGHFFGIARNANPRFRSPIQCERFLKAKTHRSWSARWPIGRRRRQQLVAKSFSRGLQQSEFPDLQNKGYLARYDGIVDRIREGCSKSVGPSIKMQFQCNMERLRCNSLMRMDTYDALQLHGCQSNGVVFLIQFSVHTCCFAKF